MVFYTPLAYRAVLQITGKDRASFLQGLVTGNVDKVSSDKAIWSALLSPQGKFHHEFFLTEREDALLLDGEAARLGDLQKRLSLYRLRAQATVAPSEDLCVLALYGEGVEDILEDLNLPFHSGASKVIDEGVVFRDPRLDTLGLRAVVAKDHKDSFLTSLKAQERPLQDYDIQRLSHGIPDGSRDLEVDKSILLEAGFDELGGIDWNKGCYLGQELTARTKYRGLIKKRLVPLEIFGKAPAYDEPLTSFDGQGHREIGRTRSSVNLTSPRPSGATALALGLVKSVELAAYLGQKPDVDANSKSPMSSHDIPPVWHAGDIQAAPFLPDWFDWSFTKGEVQK